MRAFKNPCDGSFANKLGNVYPYCYLLQYTYKISIAINKDQCSCDVYKTCKSITGSCKHIESKNMHIFNCLKAFCDACQLFRQYYFICYKMIFTEEPMAFQIYVKELLNLIQSKKVKITSENVLLKEHCYDSNKYQDHKKCAIFDHSAFMIYKYNIKKINR